MEAKDTVKLEPENTLIGRFQKERTDAISEMFNNKDEYGIYPTSRFFAKLDNCVRELLDASILALIEEASKIFNEAIELIKVWHNMGEMDEEQAKYVWGLYQQSPEMKRLKQRIRDFRATHTILSSSS